jgi:hypothetical protein
MRLKIVSTMFGLPATPPVSVSGRGDSSGMTEEAAELVAADKAFHMNILFCSAGVSSCQAKKTVCAMRVLRR